jgi:hypothetical protein
MKFPTWLLLVFLILAIVLFTMFPIPAIVVALVQNQNPRVDEHPLKAPASGVTQPRNLGKDAASEVLETKRQQALASYSKLPLSFEANHGRTDPQVKFLSRGRGYGLFLTSTDAVLTLTNEGESKGEGEGARHNRAKLKKVAATVLRMKPLGANPEPEVSGLGELPGRSNYFIGSDPPQWQTNIPNYAAVLYRDLYRGVDLIYYGNQEQLEYDWVVAPGADPKAIRLAIEGAEKISIGAEGDVVIETGGGEVRLHKPVVYQVEEGPQEPDKAGWDRQNANLQGAARRHILDGRYILKGNHAVAFEVAAFDASRPLVIDPALSYSTYFGGTDADQGNAIAVDSSGNAYITGFTSSIDFPTKNPFQASFHGIQDAFVAKFNPAISGAASLVYSTYLGSSNGNAFGFGIAVDSAGNAYVTGSTASTNFPTTPGAFQTIAGSPGDAFVTKLDPTGSALVYSTYLGGSGNSDQGLSITVDSTGNAYVTGFTDSLNFPAKNAFQPAFGGGLSDAFVTKLNAAGSALLYSTYLGGSGDEQGHGIALDSVGNVYVSGNTGSANFPVTPGVFQTALGGVGDAFVAKLDPAASGAASLLYSTYLGGNGSDEGFGIAVDSNGNAYVTGLTFSTDFPTSSGAFQTTLGGADDAFVTKLNATGSGLIYSTYLGGASLDQGNAIAVDSSGNAYVTGEADSSNFPVTADAFLPPTGGDAFITKLNVAGSALVFSTGFGGALRDIANGIALDSSANFYVTGVTDSTDFPTLNPFQPTCSSCNLMPVTFGDAFVAKISVIALPSADFVMSASPTSTTVTAGGTINSTLSLTPLNGFSQTVALTCSGQPPASTCSLSPSSVTLNGASASTAKVTITTTARSALVAGSMVVTPGASMRVELPWLLPLLAFAILAGSLPANRRRAGVGIGMALFLATFWVACGGGGGGGGMPGGTPPGTYTITLTGTSGSLSHITTVSLTVN